MGNVLAKPNEYTISDTASGDGGGGPFDLNHCQDAEMAKDTYDTKVDAGLDDTNRESPVEMPAPFAKTRRPPSPKVHSPPTYDPEKGKYMHPAPKERAHPIERSDIMKESRTPSNMGVKSVLCCVILIMPCITLCVVALALTGAGIYMANIGHPLVTIESAKDASNRVKTIARGQWDSIGHISENFVKNLRKEYKHRADLEHVKHSPPWGRDPIDGREGNQHHQLIKANDPLPPLCPMLYDHLNIYFDLGDQSYDPFGLPCALEMHWSHKLDKKEVDRDNRMYMDTLQHGYNPNAMIVGSDRDKYQKRPTLDAPFNTIHCTRRYRMKGFTPWECTGKPELPTRYSMVYNIGCVEINANGKINMRSSDMPGLKPNDDGRVVITPTTGTTNNKKGEDSDDTIEWLNPAYDPTFQHVEQGHYCYINYAVTDNPEWTTTVRECIMFIVTSFMAVFIVIFFITTSPLTLVSSMLYWTCACTMGGMAYAYLVNENYVHPHMLALIRVGIVVMSLFSTMLYAIIVVVEVALRSGFEVDNGCTRNHPLFLKIMDSVVVANGGRSIIKAQRARRLKTPTYTSRLGSGRDFVRRVIKGPSHNFPPGYKSHQSDDEQLLYYIDDDDDACMPYRSGEHYIFDYPPEEEEEEEYVYMDDGQYSIASRPEGEDYRVRKGPEGSLKPLDDSKVLHAYHPESRNTIAGDNPINRMWATEEERQVMYAFAKQIVATQEGEDQQQEQQEWTRQHNEKMREELKAAEQEDEKTKVAENEV